MPYPAFLKDVVKEIMNFILKSQETPRNALHLDLRVVARF